MATAFFDLPLEIRLQIYQQVFQPAKLVLASDRADANSLLPITAQQQNETPRSAQLLRVCKTILHEARPVLYANTTVQVVSHVFAGRLPSNFSDGLPMAPYIRHLIWHIECDMMKHMYEEDLRLQATDLTQLSSLEIRCRAETWRDSFLGEHCDRDRFVKGREQVLNYARLLQGLSPSRPELVEDQTFLGKGCVRVRMNAGRTLLGQNVRQLTRVEITS